MMPALRHVVVRDAAFTVTTEDPDFSGFWSRMAVGTWEPETLDLLDRLLEPAARFVDVGAWIGPTSLYAAHRGARVAAYECDPVALRLLHRNLELNPSLATQITVHPHALGEHDGRLRMWSQALGDSETSIFAWHEREGQVRACQDSVLVDVRDARVVFEAAGYAADASTLIKLDVEGAEFTILPHLAPLVATSRAVWYVSFHELNLNPPGTSATVARAGEMQRALSAFAGFHWYDARMTPLDQSATLRAIGLVFSPRSLLP
jgi:FkbM family methyltransferase